MKWIKRIGVVLWTIALFSVAAAFYAYVEMQMRVVERQK